MSALRANIFVTTPITKYTPLEKILRKSLIVPFLLSWYRCGSFIACVQRCVYDTRSKLKLCYAVYLHRKDVGLLPVLTLLAMNTRHNNPIVSQRTCLWQVMTCLWQVTPGTIIKFCGKDTIPCPPLSSVTH